MSWVTTIWAMVASACITLATVHLLIWFRARKAWANLFFSMAAAGTAGMSFLELSMIYAQTIEQFATAMRWCQFPIAVVIISLVGFVQVYLRLGRRWLAWTIIILRVIVLPLNFLTGLEFQFY